MTKYALAIGADELHVWSAPLHLPDEAPEHGLGLLAPEEQERARRLRVAELRARFIRAHVAVRRILAAHLGIPPEAIVFTCGPHGKPALACPEPARSLRFNLSHAGDLLLVAVAREREVGIDLERIEPGSDILAIAARTFSPWEKASLALLPPPSQREAFYRGWTRKEAYVKGRGEGFALPFDRFTVSLAPGEPAALLASDLHPADVGAWQLFDLPLPAGYTGAVATTAGPVTIVRHP